jgi:hypothetical protein
MAKIPPILCGVAGEYFVAAELSRRGYIASITLRNTGGIDILASNAEATRQVGIQVKSNQGEGRNWILSPKAERYHADNLYYIFVNLKEPNERPAFFIVPSEIVARTIKEGHEMWLNTPGRRGQKHMDSAVRKFRDPDGTYFERWDLLGL